VRPTRSHWALRTRILGFEVCRPVGGWAGGELHPTGRQTPDQSPGEEPLCSAASWLLPTDTPHAWWSLEPDAVVDVDPPRVGDVLWFVVLAPVAGRLLGRPWLLVATAAPRTSRPALAVTIAVWPLRCIPVDSSAFFRRPARDRRDERENTPRDGNWFGASRENSRKSRSATRSTRSGCSSRSHGRSQPGRGRATPRGCS